MNKTRTPRAPRIGMDQLQYFVNMTKGFLDTRTEATFWDCMRTHCPDLMQAINASFVDGWRTITFTRDLHTPTFDLASPALGQVPDSAIDQAAFSGNHEEGQA